MYITADDLALLNRVIEMAKNKLTQDYRTMCDMMSSDQSPSESTTRQYSDMMKKLNDIYSHASKTFEEHYSKK